MMEKAMPGRKDYFEAFIKTAQYLTGLTTQQDIWSETGKVLVHFFDADVGGFEERRPDGEAVGRHWTFSERFSIRGDLEAETGEAIAEVLESGFLSERIISAPDPLSVACFPVTQENKVIAVMVAGYGMSEPIPRELLNVYMAVAGLVGTTVTRLASEQELRRHRERLEQLVKERTAELTKANEKLREGEVFLNILLNAIPSPVFYKDRDGRYLGFNRAFEMFFGATKDRMIGKTVFEINPPELAKIYYEQDKRLFENESVQKYESQVKSTDGELHDVIFNKAVFTDSQGTVNGLIGVILDITDRKRAEQDLLRERNRLQALLDFYRRAYARVHDIESFIIEECIRITESSLGFFGFINEDETLMRAHLWSTKAMEGCAVDFRPVEFSIEHAGIWAEAIREHKPLIVNDYSMPDPRKKGYPDGHVSIKRLMSIPIIRGSKAVAIMAVANKEKDYSEMDIPHIRLFLENVWDMIMRKKAEEELRALNEQLEQKVEERTSQLIKAREELIRKEKLAILGQLAGVVGHEIRNPLGVMNNAVYFLKTVMTDADETVKEYLDIVKQEIDNSQRIITDLLDFARTKTPQAVSTGVYILINDSLGRCRIPENVSVEVDIPESVPAVNVDQFQMGQVFQNLISNALQAMPEGGTLIIAARQLPGVGDREDVIGEGTADFRSPISGFVEITVADTGEGISPENMEKLFQPLFTTKAKGIGLGLTICKNLVEANGGRIKVESKLGEGTTFMVILPVREWG